VKVHVNNGNVDTAVRRIDAENVMKSFIDLMEDSVLEWCLLVGAGISLFTVALSMGNRTGPQGVDIKK
jgi:hypothetical protein